MKLNLKTLLVVAMNLIMVGGVSAASVKVEWQNVEHYRDIDGVTELQSRFEKRVMDELTAHWEKLGEKLPENYQLAITMTDLDLAGRVEPTYGVGGSAYMRILDDISYPMMSFAFTYRDGAGNIIAENPDVRLKDLGASSNTMRTALKSGKDALYFEKRLMDRWFDKQFKSSAN